AALLGLHGESARGVWEFLQDHHINTEHALEITLRIFRGCPLSGGMVFGKEFQYLLGLHQWLIRMETLTPEDMSLALSGKMDFLEMEMLKNSALKNKLRYATPPERLMNWMKLLKKDELKARLEFKKVA
ncbi:MAG: tyrosine/phenylalanine carboxypeptidase domain-containing protein, partial [Bacteroidota bacterium]